MSKFSRTILPLFFALAIFSAAPSPASAAPPAGEGTFDCLGSFDWGCNIIGYLFEGKGLASFSTTATVGDLNRAGQPITADATSVQNALKKMMGFFSNAMLIIASLMLLYHLIVMVAETAHTGTIGGKETNQLWAPIRLVIAIGLLVPLATTGPGAGLNSGQYIILQIAKWGAGLGSQVWKTFATTFAEQQTFVSALSPAVATQVSQAFDIYVCMAAINSYADRRLIPNPLKVVEQPLETLGSAKVAKYTLDTDSGDAICGRIIYHYPVSSGGADADIAARLTTANSDAFYNFRTTLRDRARDYVETYFRPAVTPTAIPPRRTVLNQLVAEFQNRIIQQTNSMSTAIATEEYQRITDHIKRAAETYGWMSAGTWFMAITRAQGSILSSALAFPTTHSPPDVGKVAANSDDIYSRYQTWAEESALEPLNPGVGVPAPPNTSGRPAAQADLGVPLPFNIPSIVSNTITGAGRTIEQTVSAEFGNYIRQYAAFLRKSPRDAAKTILEMVDRKAGEFGIWQAAGRVTDPGHRITNVNPMADLVDMGHRHLQLSIDLWGTAMIYAAAGVGAELAARITSPRTYSIVAPDSSWVGSLMATLGLTVAFFLSLFAAFSLIAGVALAFFIPLMPFVRFFYAIVTWAGAIIEAMICLPLLALAHLNPTGQGFAGQKPQFGYRMLFQIFLRPALAVFGLIGALLIFYVAVRFLNGMYYQAVLGVANFGTGPTSIVARVIFSIFYVTLMYICATMSFKMIDHIPQRALQWMGDQTPEVHYQDDQNTLSAVSSQVQSQMTNDVIRSAPEQFGRLRLR